MSQQRGFASSALAAIALSVTMIGVTGCGMLDVSNPTVIQDETLDNAAGATHLWNVARYRLTKAINLAASQTALLTDELFVDSDPTDTGDYALLDHRESEAFEGNLAFYGEDQVVYGSWQILRRDATVAIPRNKAFGPPAHTSELYSLRGYSALGLAEQICPGFPLRELVDLKPVYGPPLTTDETFEAALDDFDSALVYSDPDSARSWNMARLGKARALLGLGRFAEAGTLAADVQDGFSEDAVPQSNFLAMDVTYMLLGDTRSVAERDGGTGLDYVSAADPRVALYEGAPATYNDPFFNLRGISKYEYVIPESQAPIIVGNDVEARLIQAEAQLQPAAAPAGPWLATLNTLRASAGLSDTNDPGTADGRIDLLFRERAFWLFATGHRLGDMRRLVARYGRSAEDVFPTGTSWSGAPFATATSLPFPFEREQSFNPAVTGCTSR